MIGSRVWTGHPTLSRPITILGVERRWFMMTATLGLGMWNALNSILTAAFIFSVLYVAGLMGMEAGPGHAPDHRGRAIEPSSIRPRQTV